MTKITEDQVKILCFLRKLRLVFERSEGLVLEQSEGNPFTEASTARGSRVATHLSAGGERPLNFLGILPSPRFRMGGVHHSGGYVNSQRPLKFWQQKSDKGDERVLGGFFDEQKRLSMRD
jgi:hypothetical protein